MSSAAPGGAFVVVAGASGNLGSRIVRLLAAKKGVRVRALVRQGGRSDGLKLPGVEVLEVDYAQAAQLDKACVGGVTCVVSALCGLRAAVVDAQCALLEAAIRAHVPRFIPSDFSIDFAKLATETPKLAKLATDKPKLATDSPKLAASNRNLELRLEFMRCADARGAEIAVTSVLNGMFTDLLIGPAPFVLFPIHRVLCYGDAGQEMDFTTTEDTAAYTVQVAVDPAPTPRRRIERAGSSRGS